MITSLHQDVLHFSETLTREEHNIIQLQRFREISRYAYNHVVFWQKTIQESSLGNPGNLKELADIQKISVTTKQLLKQVELNALVARGIAPTRIFTDTTSGSTGVPFKFFLDRYCAERETAMILRGPRWIGYQSSDKFIRLFPKDFPLLSYCGINIPIRDLNRMDEVIYFLARQLPDRFLLYSHLSTMLALARRTKKILASIKPRAVLVASERLFPEIKEFITEAFDCPLSDSYGSHEIDNVAQTCRLGTMHVNMDHCFVEIVDGKGSWVEPGQRGRIIVTSFNNYVMPFIRYDMGDIGSIKNEPCSCGLPFPILDFDGRSMEFVELPNGKIIHPFDFRGSFNKRFGSIAQFQVIRTGLKNFLVKIVPLNRQKQQTPNVDEIKEELQKRLGSEVESDIQIVDQIFKIGEKNTPYVDLLKSKNLMAE